MAPQLDDLAAAVGLTPLRHGMLLKLMDSPQWR